MADRGEEPVETDHKLAQAESRRVREEAAKRRRELDDRVEHARQEQVRRAKREADDAPG